MNNCFRRILFCSAHFMVLMLSHIDMARSQSIITGICNDFDHDRSFPISIEVDTFMEGFNTYVTTYQLYNGLETENKLPILNIIVSHFPPDKIVELSISKNKPAKKSSIAGNEVNTLRLRYSYFGNLIVAERNDTIPFDSTYRFYKIVYFFADKSKKQYVYLNQIGETYTHLPFTYVLSPIPDFIFKDDSIAYARFLLEGTIERSAATWRKEYEAFRQDSIRTEDSLRREELRNFLTLRNDTFITASADTSTMYAGLLKRTVQEVGLNFRKMKMKYEGLLTINTDTSGHILSVMADSILTGSYGYQLFRNDLKEAIEAVQVPPVLRTFQGKQYAMQTRFYLQVSAFCDTLLQTVKKERDTLEYELHLYENERLTEKLSSVLTEKGRYSFVLYYCEMQREKYYYITKLKGSGRNFGDMVFEEN